MTDKITQRGITNQATLYILTVMKTSDLKHQRTPLCKAPVQKDRMKPSAQTNMYLNYTITYIHNASCSFSLWMNNNDIRDSYKLKQSAF
jgi:hypothetical protein